MPNRRQTALASISFHGLLRGMGAIGAFAPHLSDTTHLKASQTALLVVAPALLGALTRIPRGILADRFGGPRHLLDPVAAAALPVWIVPQQATCSSQKSSNDCQVVMDKGSDFQLLSVVLGDRFPGAMTAN
jgi:hypothetical protein